MILRLGDLLWAGRVVIAGIALWAVLSSYFLIAGIVFLAALAWERIVRWT